MIKSDHIGKFILQDYDGGSLEMLETAWKQLEKGADMTAFQSFDWNRYLWQTHSTEGFKNLFREFRYILVSVDEKPLLIAPLEIHKMGIGYKTYGCAPGVYFVGRRGYSDYLNFIYEEFDAEAVQALLEYIGKTYRQKSFYFDRILESAASYRFLSSSYPGDRIPVACAALVLPDTFEAYRSSLSKNTRQNIRTAINRAKKNDLMLTHQFLHDESEEIKEQIIALNAQRLKKKNNNAKKGMSFAGRIYCWCADIYGKLFSAKQDVVRNSKNTFCFIVKDGEKLAGFFWGIRNDHLNEYYVILAGVGEEYEWYSPNIAHLYTFLEEHYQNPEKSIRILDFTRGAEGYKKTIGCVDRPVYSYYFKR